MSNPDYKVVYKTRPIEPGEPRPRIPTALDPYDYPEDRAELKYGVARAKIAADRRRQARDDYDEPPSLRRATDYRDEYASVAAPAADAASVTKTTYSVNSNGIAKDTYASGRAAASEPLPPIVSPSTLRGPTAADQDAYSSRSRDYQRYERDPVRDREIPSSRYDIERPSLRGGAYIVDARGDNVDVIYPGRGDTDRGFGGYRNDPYTYSYDDRAYAYRDSTDRRYEFDSDRRADPRLSDRSIDAGSRGLYSMGALAVNDPPYSGRREREARPYDEPRTSGRWVEDDDWRMVGLTQEKRIGADQRLARDSYDTETQGRRLRSSGQSLAHPASEDDYVLVSPPRQAPPSAATGTSLRSAMLKEDTYPPEERLRRRRSRSISFRDAQVATHDCGERRHERPGAEAANCGRYLSHYDPLPDPEDRMDYEYRDVSEQRARGSDRSVARDDRYPPQRARSRRRRREDDDESYYSERIERKTTKETKYY